MEPTGNGHPSLFNKYNPEPCHDAPTPVSVYADHQAEVDDERDRLDNAKGRILARLRQGPATNLELAEICLRYTGRMSDLRIKDGHRIEKEHLGSGTWVYRLTE